MNNMQSVRTMRLAARRRAFKRGQSAVELAFAVPLLILILQIAADFGRLFYLNVEINGAARAGAQYGANNVTTAADSAGIIQAAKLGGADVQNMMSNVSATQCTCATGTSIPACPASYCTAIPNATYVQVTVQATFKPLITYPGLSSQVPLSAQAILPVQQ